jgi:acetyl esterase/lipase
MIFLVVAAVGLAVVLNARRALHFPLFLVPSFFASWLTVELAPQILVLHIAGVGLFIAAGAAAEWQGWVGLGLSMVTGVLLWGMVREAYRVRHALDDVLTKAIGPTAAHTPVVWKEFVFPFKLWSRRISRERDLPYADPGTRRYRLDVWHDSEASGERPCLLYVPGGAWLVGISNKNHQGKPLLIEMASRGWVCFSMNYPISPRAAFPDHIVAVKRAIAWIRAHAHEYGGDPNFLMISGNSAGAHLSSLAALSANDPALQPGFEKEDTSIQAAAPLYGVYDFTGAMLEELPRRRRRQKQGFLRFIERTVVKRRLAKDLEFFESVSPWHRIGPHAPPFFVIHGAMDTLAMVEEARAFVGRLSEVSDEPVIYAELRGTQHAFDTFHSIRSLYAVRAIARFGDWAYEKWKVSDAGRAPPADRELRSPTSGP